MPPKEIADGLSVRIYANVEISSIKPTFPPSTLEGDRTLSTKEKRSYLFAHRLAYLAAVGF